MTKQRQRRSIERRGAALVALAVATFGGGRAEATPFGEIDGPPAPAPAPAASSARGEWYGWQTLIALGAAGMFVAGGYASESPVPFGIGLAMAGLAPSVVHFAHRNYVEGLAIIPAIAVAPAAGMLGGYIVGSMFDKCYDITCGGTQDRIVIGAAAATVLVLAFDVALLSWTDGIHSLTDLFATVDPQTGTFSAAARIRF